MSTKLIAAVEALPRLNFERIGDATSRGTGDMEWQSQARALDKAIGLLTAHAERLRTGPSVEELVAGNKVLVQNEGFPPIAATVVRMDEGWVCVRFGDDSTVTLRPSLLARHTGDAS